MDKLPYVNTDKTDNLIKDIEVGIAVFVFLTILKKAFHKPVAGLVFVISAAISVLILTGENMTSDWAYVFWAFLATAVISASNILIS